MRRWWICWSRCARSTLLILVETLFGADFSGEMKRLWKPVLDAIGYISPGVWMVWRGAPRRQYRGGIRELDGYLYRLIAERRRLLETSGEAPDDLLGGLLASGMGDDLARDQMLTMLIAGHDTSTALLAWSLYLLGSHPGVYRQAQDEAVKLLDEDSTLCRAVEWVGDAGQRDP